MSMRSDFIHKQAMNVSSGAVLKLVVKKASPMIFNELSYPAFILYRRGCVCDCQPLQELYWVHVDIQKF